MCNHTLKILCCYAAFVLFVTAVLSYPMSDGDCSNRGKQNEPVSMPVPTGVDRNSTPHHRETSTSNVKMTSSANLTGLMPSVTSQPNETAGDHQSDLQCCPSDNFHFCTHQGMKTCIDASWFCDGYEDCDSGEDERLAVFLAMMENCPAALSLGDVTDPSECLYV